MLNVYIDPGSFDQIGVRSFNPMKHNGSSKFGFSGLSWTIEVLFHSTAQVFRQTDVQDHAGKRGQHIASGLVRSEPNTIPPEVFAMRRSRDQLIYIHSSIDAAVLMETL